MGLLSNPVTEQPRFSYPDGSLEADYLANPAVGTKNCCGFLLCFVNPGATVKNNLKTFNQRTCSLSIIKIPSVENFFTDS